MNASIRLIVLAVSVIAAAVSQTVASDQAPAADQALASDPPDTFRGWLRTITQNKITDHYRSLAKRQAGRGGTSGDHGQGLFSRADLGSD